MQISVVDIQKYIRLILLKKAFFSVFFFLPVFTLLQWTWDMDFANISVF